MSTKHKPAAKVVAQQGKPPAQVNRKADAISLGVEFIYRKCSDTGVESYTKGCMDFQKFIGLLSGFRAHEYVVAVAHCGSSHAVDIHIREPRDSDDLRIYEAITDEIEKTAAQCFDCFSLLGGRLLDCEYRQHGESGAFDSNFKPMNIDLKELQDTVALMREAVKLRRILGYQDHAA